MSISNRRLKPGDSAEVTYESKWRTFLGRVACLFRGHKPVTLLGRRYCVSCWRRFDKEDEYMDRNITQLIREWAEQKGLSNGDPNKQALKLGEEFGELFEGLAKGNEHLTKDSIGDMYVVMTILSQQLGFTIEECVGMAYDEIKGRTGKMVDGVFVKREDLE